MGEVDVEDDITAEDARRLDGMTKVMLLFDSEHQTAVNIRYPSLHLHNLVPFSNMYFPEND